MKEEQSYIEDKRHIQLKEKEEILSWNREIEDIKQRITKERKEILREEGNYKNLKF